MYFSSREDEADPESRKLVAIAGGVLAVAGLVLMIWPTTGVVTISWLLAGVTLVLGCVMVYVATKLRRFKKHIGKPS